MATEVSKMNTEERKNLMTKLNDLVKKHKLEDKLKVVCHRETVCALASDGVEDNYNIKCEASFPPDKKDDVEAFKTSAKELTEGI